MDSRSKSNDHAFRNRDHDVMTRVIEKFACEGFVDGVIEDIVRDFRKQAKVILG